MLSIQNQVPTARQYYFGLNFKGKAFIPVDKAFHKELKTLSKAAALGVTSSAIAAINMKLNDDEIKKLSNDEVNDLTLYFDNMKRNNSDTVTYLYKKGEQYKAIIKNSNGNTIEEIPIKDKRDYGQDAHIVGDIYRNNNMTEAEKALDNEIYLKTRRQKYYNSEKGDVNLLPFEIPVIKDRPLRVAFVAFDPRGEDKVSFSVGINYLEAALKKDFGNQVDTLLLDDQIMDINEIKMNLEKFKPDLIGVSSKIHTYHKSSPFLEYCNENFPKSLIMAGGTTPTYAFREVLNEHPNILISVGNGEKSLCGIADIMLGNKNKEDIFYVPNVVIKQTNGELIMSKQLTDDLDIKPTETNLKEIIAKNGMVYFRLSQGCWGHCTFCSQPEKWETAKIDAVVDTLKEWNEKYGLASIFFTDDEMVPQDPKAALDRLDYFSSKMIEKNVNVSWFMNLRADAINFLDNEKGDKVLKQLKESNCSGFFLGIESGSDRQLKRYAKQVAPMKTNVEINKRIIDKLRSSGIPVTAGYIMFDPLMPTLTEIKENLEFFDNNDLLNLQSRLNNNMRVQKGTNYIQMVANMKLGLLGDLQPNLLTYDSKYLDPRVGTIKDHINVFIEEIRPQYELIYNAKYKLKINPDSSNLKQLEQIESKVKQITRNYVADMINLFDVTDEDKMIDEMGVKAFSNDFWLNRMEKLTNEVNEKIPELYKCRQYYKKELNDVISELKNIGL